MANILQRPSTAAIMPQQQQQRQRDRLRYVVEQVQQKLKAGSRIDRREFYRLCIILSRAIDFTVASNQAPPSTQEVLQLLKQICSQKDDPDVRPAVMVLMLSFKSAVHTGWFNVAETGELLDTVNGLFQQYHGGRMPHHQSNSTASTADVEQFICDILVRFYPWLKLNKLVLSTEAKIGYEVLVCDFHIASQPSSNEQVRLFTVRKDRIDASACLMTPALVSFIMNGHGVEKRTIISMDNGPQIPTDCTKLIKAGGNLLQIVGEFQAPYCIVLACTSTAAFRTTALHLPEVQPLGSHSDDDLTEGPSRVSLCCPISRKRIITPVKGTGCRHLQCFDYDNYMEINERRPSWRCPYCNVPVTYKDLRLDKKMTEVLNEVRDTVLDVMIANDGSWEAFDAHSHHYVRESVVVDLSTDDDLDLGQEDRAPYVESSDPTTIHFRSETDVEDRKPDLNRTDARAHEQADVPGSFDAFCSASEDTESERDNPAHTCEVPVRTSSSLGYEFLRSDRPQIAIQALPAFAPGVPRARMTASNRPCSPAHHSSGHATHNRLQSPEAGIYLEQWQQFHQQDFHHRDSQAVQLSALPLQQSFPRFSAQQFQDADPGQRMVQWPSTVGVTQQMQTLNNARHNLEQQLANRESIQNNQGPQQHFCQTLPAQYDPRFWQQLPPVFSQLSNANQSLTAGTPIRPNPLL